MAKKSIEKFQSTLERLLVDGGGKNIDLNLTFEKNITRVERNF